VADESVQDVTVKLFVKHPSGRPRRWEYNIPHQTSVLIFLTSPIPATFPENRSSIGELHKIRIPNHSTVFVVLIPKHFTEHSVFKYLYFTEN